MISWYYHVSRKPERYLVALEPSYISVVLTFNMFNFLKVMIGQQQNNNNNYTYYFQPITVSDLYNMTVRYISVLNTAGYNIFSIGQLKMYDLFVRDKSCQTQCTRMISVDSNDSSFLKICYKLQIASLQYTIQNN